ncbi:MAG: 30S ribosomal protein S9 [Candidatus Nealsonbacteria bacterium CG23_combo_of_CG06-09_8_20_14_all_40_13]|uniref:Small ribosomal subunit protein uS9 n=1 Tax=Candidatus Nealsonbacteria bacterium CG23_combo_of_CG06-09_8_20_14_all_40_13 TaxID=1974724 RepID=A0A2G9YQY0_9BACT|nr:MAG: 30S ribosomal protein S9 [Candidatus Nealsonbacteria bacterium CG23_combo_of_CG06-09_8_20_14_all_40_13]PIR71241.1 MAG: 30S ribosomal protein S9 [Candidatus Nealsonbacteria bacterium CG10_big_fil_rev_8_21_14_0_10_40_24]
MVNKSVKQKYYYALGRRKTATAKVYLKPGTGLVKINNKDFEVTPEITQIYNGPLDITGNLGKFDITAKVSGGGFSSQKEAIRLGVARALLKYDDKLKQVLRKNGFLTRDPREKERKKPGLKGARKAPQWQKR